MLLHITIAVAACLASETAQPLDLAPARWLWYPSTRCLPNTFVLFRKEIELPAAPRSARGWISADSRYLLAVNGERVRWGPAPSDPRWPDADPIDLASLLKPGKNVLAATVLHYGTGDGTWPIGKPGFIFLLDVRGADGRKETVASDGSWLALIDRAWPPGHYRRWYLRALQEEFDARLHPYGWDRPGFTPDASWIPAMVLDCPSDRPPICSNYPDYSLDSGGDRNVAFLRARQIPDLREVDVPAAGLAESMRLRWRRSPEEYFECGTPGSYEVDREPAATDAGPGAWRVPPTDRRAAALTFEFAAQVVGWPRFTIDAPAGTVVEVLCQEAHALGGPALLDTHFHNWSRFTCREGENRFEPFDFESLRWLQLHIRGSAREVSVRDVGVRRRLYPWPEEPEHSTSEPALDRLLGACVNTLLNSAQETCVDGMGRERQQYSGDGGHQLHAIHLAFGDPRLPARFLRTFSEGMTRDGYFLDCWPAFDRLARLMERQVDMTGWGPILDHGIGFNFDCRYHHLYTGNLEALREPYPRLVRFYQYLRGLRRPDGLLPVEGLGIPSVWIDHVAFKRQRHKECAFNLYAAAMLKDAFAPIARAFGDGDRAREVEEVSRGLLEAAVRRFWDDGRGLFVSNLPWAREEGEVRLDDRGLATAVLFDLCPGNRSGAAVRALAECPPEMGFSYPCNAGWRLWALARGGRGDVVLDDLRKRWASMRSVAENDTIQEDWTAQPDSGSQWSHCAVAPLYVLHTDVAGIRPVEPGFRRCEIRPQLADLRELRLVTRAPRGPIRFSASGDVRLRRFAIAMPEGIEAEALFPPAAEVSLPKLPGLHPLGLARYALAPGKETAFEVRGAP
jgi:alpha-L-rhamnosidase